MRVVICPDKFAGTLTAVEAAEAIAEGWRSVAPDDELILRPVADGGPGFVEVLHACLGGTLIEVPTTDPLGRPVAGSVLIVGDTAYIESAQATGLHHLAPHERDPKITTSFGLGALLTATRGVRKVVIGLGGSATNDAGAGFLAALGFTALDPTGIPLPPGGAPLLTAATLTLPPPAPTPGAAAAPASPPSASAGGNAAGLVSPPSASAGGDAAAPASPPTASAPGDAAAAASPAHGDVAVGPISRIQGDRGHGGSGSRDFPEIATILQTGGAAVGGVGGVEVVGASDVDNPLVGEQGAAAVYGPQKGASAADVALLDAALANWAGVLERDLPGCPQGLAGLKGAGAAGGLGAAVLALGGRIISGIDLVLAETGLADAVAQADVVITGEGSFDHQSLRGKVIAGVAGAARDHGVPCVVLAGRVTTGRREQGAAGVTEAHSLVDHFGGVDLAMAAPAKGLRELSARMAGQYSRG